MHESNLKIEYIYHSCFSIENDKYQLIFDYYKGDLKLNKKKKIIFFASHSHMDHFNESILTKDAFYYIFSGDITLKTKIRDNIKFMNPYEDFIVDDIKIKTFGSTDAGVSFLIDLNGVHILHVGDLNWWHWKGDPKAEQEQMEKDFKKEVDLITHLPVDIVFAPVDPRLEEFYFIGGKYFIEKLRPRIFFPMHFGDNYSFNSNFISNMKNYPVEIMNIKKQNQLFNFSL